MHFSFSHYCVSQNHASGDKADKKAAYSVNRILQHREDEKIVSLK